MDPDSVRVDASRGVAFLGMATVARRAIGFARLIVLVRLLAPDEFGLYALAMVLYGGIHQFTAFGTDRYLGQKERLDVGLVRSAWGFGILRGVVVGSLIWILAPLYAGALGAAEVRTLLTIAGFAAIVSTLSNPGRILAERELQFRRVAAFEIVGTLGEAVLLVVLAYWLRSAEALAWGLVGGMVAKATLSFVFFDPAGSPRIRKAQFRELVGVGSPLLVVSIATFITTQGDDLVAGALLGATATGIYVVTYRLASLPTKLLMSVINRASIPALSRLQSDHRALNRSFEGLVEVQLCALAPAVALLSIFPSEVIGLVYGDRWLEGVPVLRALALVMVGRGLSHVANPYLLATGRFSEISRSKVIELVFFGPAVYLGTRWAGLEGLALGVGFSYLVGAGLLMARVRIPEFSWVRQMALATLSTVPAVLAGRTVGTLVEAPRLPETLLLLVVYLGVYFATLVMFRRGAVDGVRRLGGDAFPELASVLSRFGLR